MQFDIIIKNATIINEQKRFVGNIYIKDSYIYNIEEQCAAQESIASKRVIDASGLYLFPGVIDDQVHFREPGLTHKGDIASESKAAAAGGITSFMEMPNTQPQTTTQDALEGKFKIAKEKAYTNYSFYMGATNDNIDEILKTDMNNVCGLKVFMGSSTGNMLVDNPDTLKGIFSQVKLPIAVHCEDERTIQNNLAEYKTKYNNEIPFYCHPKIRSAEACYKSSSMAVELAQKYNTRLHILHLSTAKELDLLDNSISHRNKRITAEVCVHHLWFNQNEYNNKGAFIKWNPAIKSEEDQLALIDAVNNNKIDVIATDHAPHTFDEKSNTYLQAPSGGPLAQHSLVAMLELYHKNLFSLEKIADKMCHYPADIFQIEKRGYIKEGYFADLVLVDLNQPWTVSKENILYKCKWSPFEGTTLKSKVLYTIINGNVVYDNGSINKHSGLALTFNRT